MRKHAAKRGIKIIDVPFSYKVALEKLTGTLTSEGELFDITWHNDDWGPVLNRHFEPTDDLEGMKYTYDETLDVPFLNAEGRRVAVPMVHTIGVFFYRKDLVAEDEIPATWDAMVTLSKKLQSDGKVKWGFVGGMAMNFTWQSWFWSLWNNSCDVFYPVGVRLKVDLEKNNYRTMLAEPCHREMVEFWWDNINTHKISPKSMPSYTVDDALAIFMAGDAAFITADSTQYGALNDPKRSKVSGNIGIAPFPKAPRATGHLGWNSIWAWAVPNSIPEERKKAAKAVLNDMLLDIDGQVAMFEKTAGPPPSMKAWDVLAKSNPLFNQLKTAILDVKAPAGTFYFENWPKTHKAYSDTVVRAVTGAREDIPKVLEMGAEAVQKAAAD